MKRLAARMATLLMAAAGLEANAADVDPGKPIFDRVCAQCHAPGFGHPGTQQLGWKRGTDRAVLEQRKDLVPAYVAAVVRNGLLEMPALRPTEINDTQLRQVAEYLSKSGKGRK